MMYNGFYNGWNNGYQPYINTQPVQQTQQQPHDERIFVPSAMAAEAYIVAPNSFVRLWDSSAPVFYERRTDPTGRSYPMETYEYKRKEASTTPPVQNNTDYSEAIKKLTERIEKLENATRYVTTEEKDYDE